MLLGAPQVTISGSSECSHDLSLTGRTSSLLLSAQQQLEAARFRNQVGGASTSALAQSSLLQQLAEPAVSTHKQLQAKPLAPAFEAGVLT